MSLFRAIVKSLVKNLGNLGGGMAGVPVAGDIVVDAWEYWCQDVDKEKMRGEIESYARQSVKDALAEARQIVEADAPGLSVTIQKQIIDYVCLVPGSIRRSLRRPGDHAGLTVPPGLLLRQANDLLPFLPAKLPRFQMGDRPLPDTDLELLELVGQGGFGEVWKARHVDRPDSPSVALKFCLDTSAARSLENEHNLLDHISRTGNIDGVVQLRCAHLRATPPCLEYEFVEGGDLTGLIAELHADGTPASDVVARTVLQLTRIIAHVHRQNPPIIHRDLKPANILVRRELQDLSFKIADFGIGALAAKKALLDYTTGKTKLAQQRLDTLLGAYTPLYASPEQVNGNFPDPRDDVHALGVIWYQLQTGNLALMTLPSHWRQDLLDSGMAQPYVDVLASCIGRLKERPADAGELAQRLENLLPKLAPQTPSLQAEPAKVRTASSDNLRLSRRARRAAGAVLVGVAALLACLLVLLYLGGFFASRQTPAPLPEAKADPKVPAEKEPDNESPGSEQRDLPVEPPKPLPAKVRAAWKAAGAVIGWMAWTDGELSFRPSEVDGRPGEVAAFAFYKVDFNRFRNGFDLAELGDPGQPFGLELRMEQSNQKGGESVSLKGISKFDHLAALKLDFRSTFVAGYFDVREVAQLKGLQTLSIKGNWLTDAQILLQARERGIPAQLRNLSHLQSLSLLGTLVTESGLKDLAGLKLKRLEIPAQARTDLGLKYYLSSTEPSASLNFQGWNLTDEGLLYLRSQKQLKSLNLAGTKVTDVGLADLLPLMELRTLDLGGSKVSGAGLKQLAGLGQLRSLSVAATRAAEGDFRVLASLENLQSLDLSETQVTDLKLRELAQFKQLQALDLSNTKVTDSAIKELVGLKKLQSLDLANTELTGMGLNRLEGLKHLNLGRAQVTSAGAKELSGLKHLRSLDLSKTRASDAWLKELVNLTHLETLNLSSTQVTGAGVEELQKVLSALRIEFDKGGK